MGHSVYDYHIKRDAKIKRLSAVPNYLLVYEGQNEYVHVDILAM